VVLIERLKRDQEVQLSLDQIYLHMLKANRARSFITIYFRYHVSKLDLSAPVVHQLTGNQQSSIGITDKALTMVKSVF
jgi:hypothetical protein